MMPEKWYVFYTKSRHEKKVRDLLLRRGYEVFLPLQKVVRQWSDRKKKVEVPLFNSYIFVWIPEHLVSEVVQTPGIAWVIRHNGRPAALQPREYDLINRFLQTGLLVEVLPREELRTGDWVKILDGPLKGVEGQVTAVQPNKFTVILETLGQAMRVDVEPGLLKKLE
jgi:transcription antitermination factor NusG